MNAQVQPTESRALTLAERATSAIAISKTEAQLTELAASTATIVQITNPAGYQQVHAARMTLKTQRVEIEKAGKQAREDATAFRNAVIAAEQKLIAIIEPEEERLHTLQKKWDAEREAEKKEKEQAERARIAAIHERMAELRGNTSLTSLHASSLIAEHLEDLEKLAVDESFQEFQDDAAAIKSAAIDRLSQLLSAAQAREAEERRLADERAAFEREIAEQKRIDRIKGRIQRIKEFIVDRITPDSSSELVATCILDAELIVIDDSYQELRPQAQSAKDAILSVLRMMHAERRERETHEAILAAERAELERQRQEQEAAAAAERARIAEEERIAKERLEAEAAEQRRLQDLADRQAREKRESEEAELARQREAIEAEHRRLAEESAALEQRANAQKIEVSGSVNAVAPDQHHGVGDTAAIVASPSDGLETAHAAAQVAETVASPLTSTRDLFDLTLRPAPPADMPSADEIVFALMTEFGASREQVLEWLSCVNWELQK